MLNLDPGDDEFSRACLSGGHNKSHRCRDQTAKSSKRARAKPHCENSPDPGRGGIRTRAAWRQTRQPRKFRSATIQYQFRADVSTATGSSTGAGKGMQTAALAQ
jgi:hypothetical protein